MTNAYLMPNLICTYQFICYTVLYTSNINLINSAHCNDVFFFQFIHAGEASWGIMHWYCGRYFQIKVFCTAVLVMLHFLRFFSKVCMVFFEQICHHLLSAYIRLISMSHDSTWPLQIHQLASAGGYRPQATTLSKSWDTV